jgi:hypothetical protein
MKPSQRKLYTLPKTPPVRLVIQPPPLPVSPQHQQQPEKKIEANLLFRFADGSILKQMEAKELSTFDIWHSQRTLDPNHKQNIQKEVNNTIQALDGSLYHIVRYPPDEDGESDICRIIDGQHRVSILKEHFQGPGATNFQVLVKEKLCKTEEEAIQYFKVLNHTKAIEWKEDPKLVASRYMNALLAIFENNKTKFFRATKTKRPFVQIEKLQAVFVNRRIGIGMKITPDEFAQKALAWNEIKIDHILCQASRTGVEDHALALGFTLGLDENFGWLDSVLY